MMLVPLAVTAAVKLAPLKIASDVELAEKKLTVASGATVKAPLRVSAAVWLATPVRFSWEAPELSVRPVSVWVSAAAPAAVLVRLSVPDSDRLVLENKAVTVGADRVALRAVPAVMVALGVAIWPEAGGVMVKVPPPRSPPCSP